MIIIAVIAECWSNVWPYLIAVMLFLVLIVIHEFGHFIAAKCMGVKVNEFAIGFGPKLFKKKFGETTYAVNLFPLGGYCSMEGEDETSADSRAFCNKKAWRRFVIVVMGAVFNIVLGLIIVAATLAPQKQFTTTVVSEFKEDAVSNGSGLMADDKIIAVNGRKIYTTYDLGYAFSNVEDGRLDITVLRNNRKKLLKDVRFKTEEAEGMTFIDVDFYVYPEKKTGFTYIKNTVKTAVSYFAVIWRSIFDMLAGKYGISAMAGPVGLTAAIGSVAKQNLENLLPIMALIAINLGIFNLLPLPALDGGRLLFIVIEMIIGKPVPAKYESVIHAAGFILLILFSVFITAKDIYTLIMR